MQGGFGPFGDGRSPAHPSVADATQSGAAVDEVDRCVLGDAEVVEFQGQGSGRPEMTWKQRPTSPNERYVVVFREV